MGRLLQRPMFWAFVASLGAAAIHAALYAPQLPERVASHFDLAGDADGWTSPRQLVGVYAAALALTAGSFLICPLVLSGIPDSMINLPRKDWWLAPERREATLRRISDQLLGFGVGTIAFLAGMMHLVFVANLSAAEAAGEVRLGPWFGILLGAFLVGTVAWSLALVLRFRRVPDHATRTS